MAGEEPDGGTAAGSGWAEFAAEWRRACATDRQLGILAAGAEVTFSVRCGGKRVAFRFGADRTSAAPGGPGDAEPEFTLEAPADAWALFFRRVPPPWYQSFFGMLMRVDGTQVVGNELGFAQHAHLVRRVLEIGRDTASGPAPEPSADIGPPPSGPTGRYLAAPIGGRPHRIYYEEAGVGRDLLMLHTAGADARQFHRLLADELLASRFRMVAFDLPWHGKSFPPAGAVPGDYRLSTDLYAETVMAVVEGLGLEQPIVLGASMAGEICLELAYRHPDRIGGVVACQASDHVPGRRVGWARHPKVNQALFVPEWVDGLMAPTSPPEYRSEVWWGYSQGGYAAFHGDIDFYSGDWDGTDRVPRIDTDRCPVVMLTGEYDYSCTPEMSRRTAAKIPGAVFRVMPRLGHFPYAENPPLFIPHLLDAIDSIDAIDTPTPHTEHTA